MRFNPFIAITGQYQEHVSFIFESFDLREDFFHGHQKTYLSDIVRILYYTGKRYNIYDILVMAYDLEVLKEQAKIASTRIENLPDVSHQQRLNFQMSVRNLIESFGDPKRVQMIRGLINQMMTFLEDKLSIITGPYEDLISIEDVIEQGQILFVSLNTNKNDDTTRALGRMILQNLQLVIGERYERKRADMYMPFVSVIMDEFAPIAYSNFANILQTARGSNTAFLFAMQSIPQLLSVGKAFQHDVASAPNTTFMLRTRDEDTAQHFLNASARVRQLRRSMNIRKKGIFKPSYEDQGIGSQTEIKDTRSQEEHIKNLPVGQMEYLMSDKRFGTIHGHAHVRVAPVDRLSSVVPEILPRYASLYNPEIGANLRFRDVTPRSQPQTRNAQPPQGGSRIMKTLISILILAAIFPSLNQAQTARHSRQQNANSDQSKVEAQRRYDPLAGHTHLQDGPLDKFLDSVNPRDRDFGAMIADARERLVEQTAENSYFWITLGRVVHNPAAGRLHILAISSAQ